MAISQRWSTNRNLLRAYCVAAAVAFLIAGSGTASAETEDIGPPTTAFPDDGVAQGPGLFRDGNGLGTSKGDFTSLSVGGKIVSRSDNGAPDGQDGGGSLPMPSDYGWNADYSSSGGLFPEAVMTDFGSVEPLIINDQIINDQTLLGDSDHAGGLFVTAFGSSSLGLSIFDPSEDRPRRGGSYCSSDGTSSAVHRCQTGEYLSFLITTSTGAWSDAGYELAQQIPNFPGSNPFFGGANPSARQIPGFEMIQNGFAMTWPSGVIQGTFPSACCDVTLPVVVGSFAPASDFVDPGGSLNHDPPPDPPDSGIVVSIGVTQSGTVPEIPPTAMLLIGFAGLALIGSRRLSRSVRLG